MDIVARFGVDCNTAHDVKCLYKESGDVKKRLGDRRHRSVRMENLGKAEVKANDSVQALPIP